MIACRDAGCWIGCPADPTADAGGGPEVCLGQWDTPFKGYMHSQQRAGRALVGVFPEVPRVHHLFDDPGFTTSRDMQVRAAPPTPIGGGRTNSRRRSSGRGRTNGSELRSSE